MKLLMTHNENIKSFDDISRHLELEVECIEVNPVTTFVAKVDKCEGFVPKHKRQDRGYQVLHLRLARARRPREGHVERKTYPN